MIVITRSRTRETGVDRRGRDTTQRSTHTQAQHPQQHSAGARHVWEGMAHTPDSSRRAPDDCGKEAGKNGEDAELDGDEDGANGCTPEGGGGIAAAARKKSRPDDAPGSSRTHAKRRAIEVATYDETKRRKTRGWKAVYFTDARKRAVRENIQVGAALLARANAEQTADGKKRRRLF